MIPKSQRQIKQVDLVTVQNAVDDITTIANRGLSFERNMPSRIYSTLVISGQDFSLPVMDGKLCRGASILFIEDQATITTQSYRRDSTTINVNLVFSDGLSHRVTMLVIYE